MTDTILSPNGVEAYSVRVVVVPGLGAVAPVGALTPGQVQALRDDVASVMNQNLGDLANVDDSAKQVGYVLQWDEANAQWVAGPDIAGIQSVWSTAYAPTTLPEQLQFWAPLYLEAHPSIATITRVRVSLGMTGTSDTVARTDHTHPPTLKGRLPFNKGAAVLGGGISDLINESVSGLIPSVVYDLDVACELEAVNTNASGRLTLHTQIGSTGTVQSLSRGFSGGVWTPVSNGGIRMGVTGVTSLSLRFWAEYESGDPTALYSGYLKYTISPRGGTS